MFASQPPHKRSGIVWWENVRVKSGERFRGWTAGPYVGADTHFTTHTIGCRRVISSGQLRCPFCESNCVPVWKGYVPLWDEHGMRWVVTVGATYSHTLADLQTHDAVTVTKVIYKGAPLRVDRTNHGPLPRVIGDDARKPQCLKAWLLRVWADEELEAWVREHPERPSDTPVSLVTPTKVITPTAGLTAAARDAGESGLLADRRRRAAETPGAESIADVLKRVPPANGKHGGKR